MEIRGELQMRTGEVMKKIAELALRLLQLLSGRRQRSGDDVAEDKQLAVRTVARLRTECEKSQVKSHADKIT
jgi:hypothetical protein